MNLPVSLPDRPFEPGFILILPLIDPCCPHWQTVWSEVAFGRSVSEFLKGRGLEDALRRSGTKMAGPLGMWLVKGIENTEDPVVMNSPKIASSPSDVTAGVDSRAPRRILLAGRRRGVGVRSMRRWTASFSALSIFPSSFFLQYAACLSSSLA